LFANLKTCWIFQQC